MKSFFTLLISSLTLFSASAQMTTNNFPYGGQTRQYIRYVPASYDGSTAVPVVLCLHGLGDNMNNFYNIGMNYVADTANFIVLVPQALVDQQFTNSTAWNSGASYMGFTLNPNVDDIGFLSALIDSTAANYNVDLTRVFSCGFSMGGFMSQRLACELNNKVAAVASVAGTIGGALNCQPGRAVPVCHFHGTGDSTVYYHGNLYGDDPEDMIAFWETNNGCSSGPIVTQLPDIANDGYTVTHTKYTSCDHNVDVELFRVDSADHVWLTPLNDISYTIEIWKFFMRFSHYSLGVEEYNLIEDLNLYPNPASESVTINLSSNVSDKVSMKVYDVLGKEVYTEQVQLIQGVNNKTLGIESLPNGLYSLTIQVGNQNYVQKFIKQ